jgi:hypothetical protein
MKFMIQVRATASSEIGAPPGPELLPVFEEMGAFHEEMARAGVLLDGSKEVMDGPFTETKELIAGYTLIQVRSVEEARAWASRFPNPFPGQVCEIEVRQLYEEADFAPGGDMAIPLAKP